MRVLQCLGDVITRGCGSHAVVSMTTGVACHSIFLWDEVMYVPSSSSSLPAGRQLLGLPHVITAVCPGSVSWRAGGTVASWRNFCCGRGGSNWRSVCILIVVVAIVIG